jgi:hypothetical protein
MPMSYHPHIRALQEAMETEGLIPKLDSAGVTQLKAEETAGRRPKTVPVAQTRIINGHLYIAT